MADLPAISASKGPANLAVIHAMPAGDVVDPVNETGRYVSASTTHNYAPALCVGLAQERP